MFYYLVQDLKSFVFSLINLHFKVRIFLSCELRVLTAVQIQPIQAQ